MDGVDDFAVVDALQVDGLDTEIGMAELALDDVEWYALAGHLDRVRVVQLMGCKAAPDAGARGQATQGCACGCGGPWPAACRSVKNADKGTDGQLDADLEPRVEVLPGPVLGTRF